MPRSLFSNNADDIEADIRNLQRELATVRAEQAKIISEKEEIAIFIKLLSNENQRIDRLKLRKISKDEFDSVYAEMINSFESDLDNKNEKIEDVRDKIYLLNSFINVNENLAALYRSAQELEERMKSESPVAVKTLKLKIDGLLNAIDKEKQRAQSSIDHDYIEGLLEKYEKFPSVHELRTPPLSNRSPKSSESDSIASSRHYLAIHQKPLSPPRIVSPRVTTPRAPLAAARKPVTPRAPLASPRKPVTPRQQAITPRSAATPATIVVVPRKTIPAPAPRSTIFSPRVEAARKPNIPPTRLSRPKK